MGKQVGRVVAAFLLAALCTTSFAFADCRVDKGQKVSLFGGADDPDVLVWDNKARLVEYAGGSSDTRKFLIPHALLARPGTKVVVQECISNLVHPKFRFITDDAIGVLIMTGRYRGKYGWVTADDVRGAGIPERRDPW
ncbi:MAG TPA: hypothetical protein VIG51_03810 [Candidatus Baltobacteraceae bacterium]|jgi:hypothetical protein